MKKLFLISTLFLLIVTPVFAGWQADIAINQQRALDYISELMYTYPDQVQRPKLIENSGEKSQRALREINAAMDKAEEMAKTGRADLIKLPQFRY